ncbi:MAG: hypothetical protein WC683_16170 [bacterium]
MSGSFKGNPSEPWRDAKQYSIEANGWAGHFAGMASRGKTLGEFVDMLDHRHPDLTWEVRSRASIRGTHLVVIEGLRWGQAVVPGDDLVLAEIDRLDAEKRCKKASKGLDDKTKTEALALASEYLASPDAKDFEPERWLIFKRQDQGWEVP